MKKNIDSKLIVKNIKKEAPRSKVSFTLDASVYKAFQDACLKEDVAASRVLEELMKEFIEGSKDR